LARHELVPVRGRLKRTGSTPPHPRIRSWVEYQTPNGTVRVGRQIGLLNPSRVHAVWGDGLPTACYVANWLHGPQAMMRFAGDVTIGDRSFAITRSRWRPRRAERRVDIQGPGASWYAIAAGVANTELRRSDDDRVVARNTFPSWKKIDPEIEGEELTLVFVAFSSVMPYASMGLGV
jgi:hypothetical protein